MFSDLHDRIVYYTIAETCGATGTTYLHRSVSIGKSLK